MLMVVRLLQMPDGCCGVCVLKVKWGHGRFGWSLWEEGRGKATLRGGDDNCGEGGSLWIREERVKKLGWKRQTLKGGARNS